MKPLAVVFLGMIFLTACTGGLQPPIPSPPNLPNTAEVATRDQVEKADMAVRAAAIKLSQLCASSAATEQMCAGGPGSHQEELNRAVDECARLVGLYNSQVKAGLITGELITLTVTNNAQFGGKLACAGSK